MRAITTLASVTTVAVLAALAPLGTAPAQAAKASDWRTEACAEQNHDGLALGSFTVTDKRTQRVKQVPSLTLTAERVTFASGVRCDLVHLHGRVPFGRELTGYGLGLTTMGDLVISGTSQGEIAKTSLSRGVGTTDPIRRANHLVLAAVVFLDVEEGTMPDAAMLPEPWRNQPYTFTHTRTTFTANLNGRVGTKRTFTVTPATRVAAERRLSADLAAADDAADRRAARQTHRLALRGVRLVMKSFTSSWTGELPH